MYRPLKWSLIFPKNIIIYLREIKDIASPKMFYFAPATKKNEKKKKKNTQEITGVKDF